MINTAKCSICHEEKDFSEFHKNRSKKNGINNVCKTCSKEVKHKEYLKNKPRYQASSKKYQEDNKEELHAYRQQYYQENKDKIAEKGRKDRASDVQSYLFKKAKAGAKKRNLEFSIDKTDVIVPEVCPILGIKLELGTDFSGTNKGPRNFPNSPSLDRIDNSKGYVKGNVMVISCRANTIKSDGTVEEFNRLSNFLNNLTFNIKEPAFEEDLHYW